MMKTMEGMRTWGRTFLLLLIGCTSAIVHAQPDSTVFNNLLIQALQGNLPTVTASLNTLHDDSLTASQVEKKQAMVHRFRKQDEQYDFHTADTVVIAIMKIYHRYWRAVLLDSTDEEAKDSALIANIGTYLRTHVDSLREASPTDLADRWNDLLQTELKAHGYFAATGKTGAFYDLLMHGMETAVDYPVTTPEDTLEVKVVFMDSVISNGWEGYATMDTYYPGGWATGDALYCARSSYDLSSELFTVSYLKHEGKHFADYKRFPKLQGRNLEYRAKLVELSAADHILYGLIRFFLLNGVQNPGNPHAYANFCVVRDLSRTLFNTERETDIEAWKKLPVERIHQASTALLMQNTQDLEAAGARTVESYIR